MKPPPTAAETDNSNRAMPPLVCACVCARAGGHAGRRVALLTLFVIIVGDAMEASFVIMSGNTYKNLDMITHTRTHTHAHTHTHTHTHARTRTRA